MRKAKELKRRLLVGVLALTLALGVFGTGFLACSFTSYAEGQATVTAPNGAKIRQEASTESNLVGGAEKGKVLTVLSQVQGADGYVWYQVQTGDKTGYIRSDLVEVTGDVPGAGGEGGEGGESAPPVEVTEVNPISADVSDGVAELLDTASSAGQVLGTVPQETVITITGYVDDAEGNRWYQTNYITEEAQLSGFIHSDHVLLRGELTLPGQEPPQDETPAPENKPHYEVVEKDGDWLLVDNEENSGYGYPIKGLFDGLAKNKTAYEESVVTIKNQKIIIIVLVFLLVGAVAGIAFLVFKIRDMSDSAYFNEVENETLRRRNGGSGGSGGQGKQKASMHTVGPEKQSARPSRPAEGSQKAGGAQGARPAGSAAPRPAGGVQGQRPAAPQGQRTGGAQGARPVGSAAQRPAGGVQGQRTGAQPSRPSGVQGQRTGAQGQRPMGASQGQRGTVQGGRKPEGASGQASQGGRPSQPGQGNPQKAQPKNFMADDDEFEFEFLNYDEDDQQ